MKLIKCKKCGTIITTDSDVLENMYSMLGELGSKIRKAENDAKKYKQEVERVEKLIKQVNHRTSTIEEKRTTKECLVSVLIKYMRDTGLVDDEKINELISDADEKARSIIEENEKALKRIYGDCESMSNKTKNDPTASRALRNLK